MLANEAAASQEQLLSHRQDYPTPSISPWIPLTYTPFVLCGELAAIHSAITILNKPEYTGPQTIMTDCLVAMYLIRQALYYPEKIRLHKHRIIIQEIAQLMLTRTHALSIYKVRAHSGVSGNEGADCLAKSAHSIPTDTSSYFQTSRQPSIPDCLTGHLKSIALCHKTADTLNKPSKRFCYQTMGMNSPGPNSARP